MAGRGRFGPGDLGTLDDIKDWLKAAVRDYAWTVRGIALADATTIPLPKEPALVAKVIEVTVTEHFKRKAVGVDGLEIYPDLSGRGYPDILLTGRAVDGKKVALDVKVARRRPRAVGAPTMTQSRITLGPFDSYFRRPDDPIPGVGVAYGDMEWHIDLVVLYDWIDANVQNVEILVVETWRVASRKQSSTTRNYIGAVQRIDDLRSERGSFDSVDDFYRFWRSQPVRGGVPRPEPESVEPEELLET